MVLIDDVVGLQHPQPLQPVVPIVGIGLVEPGQPVLQAWRRSLRRYRGCAVRPAPDSGCDLRRLSTDRAASAVGWPAILAGVSSGRCRIGDPPDPAVGDVALRIANRMLHVADQRIEPIDQVQRAVGPELHVDRPEIAIARLQQRLDRFGGEARAFFADSNCNTP